ncbi:MAG: S1 RNA-binding domain-containing protein [Chloroflexota bacterium]
MDESWWAAVLKEDEPERTARRRPPFQPSGENGPQGTPEDWAWARQLYETDDVVDLPVIGFNRGGLLVEARNLRGFVPVSHLVGLEVTGDEADRGAELAPLVGSRMLLKVIEYDPERGRIVFSQRAAMAGPGRRAALLADLQPGARVRGTVTNVTRFGAFVDLGGVEGLIHVSELSWRRVRHPSDVVGCGQEIEVAVLSIDRELGRVALSLKKLLPDPWETVHERYRINQVVEGVVTNVVKFGAFVCVDEGLEGLIHVSELGDGSFLHPRSVVREGERVRARIIHIDGPARRLGLSLREVPQRPTEPGSIEQETPALSSH